MTNSEFNDKWKAYLEAGHYGLAIGYDSVIEYLDTEVMPLLVQIEGFTFSQIKMKFGGIRFYTSLPWWLLSGIENNIRRILIDDETCTLVYFQKEEKETW